MKLVALSGGSKSNATFYAMRKKAAYLPHSSMERIMNCFCGRDEKNPRNIARCHVNSSRNELMKKLCLVL